MGRLIVVSNRLPVRPQFDEDGTLSFTPSVGGLATGLNSVYRSRNGLWLGAETADDTDAEEVARRCRDEYSCIPVFLDPDELEAYCGGFSNSTIWPTYHHFPQHARFEEDWWRAYRSVNERFADAVAEVAEPDDLIWVHDYHLQLLPAMLRERRPDANIGFFLHIPFPSVDAFQVLPWRREIIDGLLAADSIGFHTYEYVRNFLETCLLVRGADNRFGRVDVDGRDVRVDAFPMGIDVARFAEAAASEEARETARGVRAEFSGDKLILSLDRLDYTKGILERVGAYDRFLTEHPEWLGRATLVLVAVPSRSDVGSYQQLQRELDELVGHVNGIHGTVDWTPVRYLARGLDFKDLIAFYRVADVMLVTPLRDGMNLVAKEYVAVKGDSGHGVLVLSEFAGASKELSEALIINPFDQAEFVSTLAQALDMPEEAQRARLVPMLDRLRSHTIETWATDALTALQQAADLRRERHTVTITPAVGAALSEHARGAERRLILLDYDGTLVPIVPRYDTAAPDPSLLELLAGLASDAATDVAIMSGRTRADLERWVGRLPVTLVAEHGSFARLPGSDWDALVDTHAAWKDAVLPVMRAYAERTPGARIELKETAVVWHYRESDPALGFERARELRDVLEPLVASEGVSLSKGSRVLEVRAAGADKQRLASRMLAATAYDFVFAAGDDLTDEDMFAALPAGAWTVCVNKQRSRARYAVATVEELRQILASLRR